MLFEIKTKEVFLPNGESDGYETREYEVSDDIVEEWLLDIIEQFYGKKTRTFVEDFDILDGYLFYNIAEVFVNELYDKAQYYYYNGGEVGEDE